MAFILLQFFVFFQLDFIVQRQKYLELLSWQGGGVQRLAFPPWKPLKSGASSSGASLEDADNEQVEVGAILEHLNKLKGLCSAAVSIGYIFHLSIFLICI